jgi:hypothetical protein
MSVDLLLGYSFNWGLTADRLTFLHLGQSKKEKNDHS